MASLFDSSDDEDLGQGGGCAGPQSDHAMPAPSGATHFAAVHSRAKVFLAANAERTLQELASDGDENVPAELPDQLEGGEEGEVDLAAALRAVLDAFSRLVSDAGGVDATVARALAEDASRLARRLWAALLRLGRWPHAAWSESLIFCELAAACAYIALGDARRAVRCIDYGFIVGMPKEEANLVFRLVAPLARGQERLVQQQKQQQWRPLMGRAEVEAVLPTAEHVAAQLAPRAQLAAAERRDEPSLEALKALSGDQSRPVLLTGLVSAWPALAKWRSLAYFCEEFGDRVVPVEVGSTTRGMQERAMPLGQFIAEYVGPSSDRAASGSLLPLPLPLPGEKGEDAAQAQGPRPPLGYLAQHNLFEQLPELQRDFSTPRFCSYQGNSLSRSSVWFGSAGTETLLHYDSYNNLLVQVAGAKFVALFPKSQTGKLYASPTDQDELLSQGNTSQVNVGAPDLAAHPLYAQAKGFYALLLPGDTLFIPRGMWHYVKALDAPSLSVNFWINFPLD